jgi:hypothetical protein
MIVLADFHVAASAFEMPMPKRHTEIGGQAAQFALKTAGCSDRASRPRSPVYAQLGHGGLSACCKILEPL